MSENNGEYDDDDHDGGDASDDCHNTTMKLLTGGTTFVGATGVYRG